MKWEAEVEAFQQSYPRQNCRRIKDLGSIPKPGKQTISGSKIRADLHSLSESYF